MPDAPISTAAPPDARLNVADRLAHVAARLPHAVAVVCPRRTTLNGYTQQRGASGTAYAMITFAELDAEATRIACGLADWGVRPGTRVVLMVRPGIEFVTLVFALLRAGAVMVLVDPGLGRRNLLHCLSDVEPEGFVAIGVAQMARMFLRHRFPRAQWNVTVGRRWFWGGLTLEELRKRGQAARGVELPETSADDPAAIIFTSGSTGPAKGVLYTQRMFDTQVTEIQSMYGIEPGGIDLSCFPLFALFNSALGVTTVLPEMDFSRPAAADAGRLLAAANDWQVNQSFASPAVWWKLSSRCGETGERIPTLRQIFSCGAPVPASVICDTLACVAAGAKMHTPYGATECLPVATIEAAEVLRETATRTDEGAGVCIGRKFDSVEWRVIRITDDPIATIDDVDELPNGEIGELVVRGPQASPRYATRTQCNADAKITDGSGAWHRMGDVGYVDRQDRFWYCGRKSHRVETPTGTMFTACVEGVFDTHRLVRRSALVGLGPRGRQVPVVIVETYPRQSINTLIESLQQLAAQHACTKSIRHFLVHPHLPVDVRHNAKILREQLAEWAAKQLPELA